MSSEIFFNKASSEKLGWSPEFFGESNFSDDLVEKIKEFQHVFELKEDGLVGPLTFKRMELELADETENSIIFNGEEIPIDWPKVVNLTAPGALVLEDGFNDVSKERKPTMLVTHWDVCMSSKKCFETLERSNISTHFSIDNDGTIYQFVDGNDIAWHAGNRVVNRTSVGIDLSCAYYLKYNDLYDIPRPILRDVEVHGKTLEPFLGFYPIQLEAYKALIQAISSKFDIPLETPKEAKEIKKVASGEFKGTVCHYHVTDRKIDCAGLNIAAILKEIAEDGE